MQAKTLTYGPPTDEDRLFEVVMFFEYWRLIWPYFVARLPYLREWALTRFLELCLDTREYLLDALKAHKFELKLCGFMAFLVVFTLIVWM
jgi:hypothetical protein